MTEDGNTGDTDDAEDSGDDATDRRTPKDSPAVNTAADWEAAGRPALVALLESQLADLQREVDNTAVAVEDGFAVDATHVGRLRDSVAALERTVEGSLARLAEGTEPWERTARRVPDWRCCEELGLSPADVEGVETGAD